jgi:hypothetical protein
MDTSNAPSDTPSAPMSNIPDLLRVGTIPDNTAIDVETDILDSVVFNQSFCRFQLQNKGILHSNSKITLSASQSSASGVRSFFPVGVGIHALIDRAVLKVGTKTICEVEDYGHFAAYQSLFISGEHNKEREQYTTARLMNHETFYDNPTTVGAVVNDSASMSGAQQVDAVVKGVCAGRDLDQFAQRSDYASPSEPGSIYVAPFQTIGYNPQFQVNLSDLFPFLKTSQLPLYMMKEPVSLELFWVTNLKRYCKNSGASQSYAVNMVQTRCQMVADYIYYPQELMTQYAQQNQSLQFAYVDYRLAKRTIDATSGRNLILNIGGAGRICNKVVQSLSKDSILGESVLNNFQSKGPNASLTAEDVASFNGSLTYNLRYNDHFLFPVDVVNNARHFHNIVQTEGKVPFITRQEYSGEGLVLGGEIEEYTQTGQFTNSFFYLANRLNRNERINSRGIEAYIDYNTLPAGNHTLRLYIELVRMASLNNGMLDIQYA